MNEVKESLENAMEENVSMQMREVGYLEEIRLLRKVAGFKKK